MTLSIDKFKPAKAELTKLADEYKGIEINGINDVEGYKKADEARKDLKAKRVEIQKVGKVLRADALKFQKEVIAYEKDLVSIIEPIEKSLKEQQDDIKKQKERIARKKELPARNAMLIQIGVIVEESILLDMDDKSFHEFYYEKHTQYLTKKEQELNEERLKLEREKELEEAKKKAAKETEERLKREAEEKERKELEAKKEKERQEKVEKERLRKNAEYAKWLEKNDVADPNSDDVYIKREGNTFTLYKKVDSIIIK